MKIKKSINGTPSVTFPFGATVGQSFSKGDVVVLAAGLAANSVAGGLATDTVIGIAAEDLDTAVAGDVLNVDVNPELVFDSIYEGADPTVGVAYGRGTDAGQFDGDVTTNGYIVVVGNIDTTAKTADVMVLNRLYR